MKKRVAFAIVGIFSLSTFAFAAFNDVTLTTDAVISIGGYTLNVSGSSAVIESIVVDTNSFSATLAPGSSLKVSSPTHNQLSSDITSDVASSVCTGSESSITLAYSGAGTVTNVITPSAGVCVTQSGGGGFVGTCSDPNAINYEPNTYGSQLSSCRYVQTSSNSTGITSSSTLATSTSSPGINTTLLSSTTVSFPRTLYYSLEGDDVSLLQELLKGWGYATYDKVNGYFGFKTREAVVLFQTANGIEPTGNVGPMTRAKVLSLVRGEKMASSPSFSRSAFSRDLKIGSVGEDVRLLQVYLNTHDFPVSETGAGSSGSETLIFGSATRAALIRFQKAKGIVPAEGYFGPKTKSYLGGE